MRREKRCEIRFLVQCQANFINENLLVLSINREVEQYIKHMALHTSGYKGDRSY